VRWRDGCFANYFVRGKELSKSKLVITLGLQLQCNRILRTTHVDLRVMVCDSQKIEEFVHALNVIFCYKKNHKPSWRWSINRPSCTSSRNLTEVDRISWLYYYLTIAEMENNWVNSSTRALCIFTHVFHRLGSETCFPR